MKKIDIQVGGHYKAKVSGKVTTVRVDAIRQADSWNTGRNLTRYDITNLTTGRKTTFRSAQKFISLVSPNGKTNLAEEVVKPFLQEMLDKTVPGLVVGDTEVMAGSKFINQPQAPPMSSLSDKLSAAANKVIHVPHVIVRALAGTGKTTTLVEGLNNLLDKPVTITPSPQQQAVWDAIELSRGATSICFVAFNKSIATELGRRVPQGCSAMTMHSLGNRAIRSKYGDVKLDEDRVQNIISEILGKDIRDLRRQKFEMIRATEKLVSLCKMNLVDSSNDFSMEEELDRLAAHYDIEVNGWRPEVYDLVPRVLERCKDVMKDMTIDYSDMIWIPIANDLAVPKYDLLLVDEAQDLNRCQQALARKAGRRLVLCGDENQAIYGFAGADSESMNRMQQELSETEQGCVVLPLTVTRRCGKAIVAEAQRIVPDFEAHESNGDGRVERSFMSDKYEPVAGGQAGDGVDQRSYQQRVEPGDMILCRCTAPLVSQCFKFIKSGRRADIQGRDIGAGLISLVKRLHAQDVPDLVGKLSDWVHREEQKELAKRIPSDARLIALEDKHQCLLVFTEGATSVFDVIGKIESVFTDKHEYGAIKLSTIHRAKGLEAKRVFLLEPPGATVPHPSAKSAWQRVQEMNLRYVAITRAISELVYVK